MKRKVLFLSIATLFVLCAVVVPPASAQVVNGSFYLDTYKNASDGWAGPAYSSDVLQGLYTVTVQGTFSVWSPSLWSALCPGSASSEASPEYPSPSISNGPVGLDPNYVFAVIKDSPTACPGGSGLAYSLPHPDPNLQFSFDGGSTWGHVDPDAPGYNDNHKYVYTVTGTGNTFGARFLDSNTTDNYGRLLVSLHRWGQQVTGGGKIGTGKPLYTLAGTVGTDPNNPLAGQFQIVDHVNRVACHFDTFSNLAFSGIATDSPPSLYNIASFDAEGTCNDGSTPSIHVVITDNPEPSPDTIQVTGDINIGSVTLDGGNFQVYVQP